MGTIPNLAMDTALSIDHISTTDDPQSCSSCSASRLAQHRITSLQLCSSLLQGHREASCCAWELSDAWACFLRISKPSQPLRTIVTHHFPKPSKSTSHKVACLAVPKAQSALFILIVLFWSSYIHSFTHRSSRIPFTIPVFNEQLILTCCYSTQGKAWGWVRRHVYYIVSTQSSAD